MFYVREMVITPAAEEHIWSKHRVSPEEVDETCLGDPFVLRGRDGSYAVYGRSESGRYLVVFLYPRGRGVFELATARDMTESERRRYQRSGKR